MRKILCGMLVVMMLLMVVTSSLDLPILGSDVQDFERASSKTMSTNPEEVRVNMTEQVWIYDNGSCRLTIFMNVSSYPLNTTYRRALGLGSLDVPKDAPIPVNKTIPVPMDINTNATLLPGGYNNITSMAGYNGTSITNATYTDTPPDTNITQHYLYVKDEAGESITQPVEARFLNAVIQEQWHSFGIRITEINASMYGMNGECFVMVNASGLMQVVHCGEIFIGPLGLNASLDRAGFILNKIGFIQQMLRNFYKTENQEYVYNSTWRTNFFFTESAFLTDDSWQELVDPPKNWTVDFGSGTNMTASILEASTEKNIFLEETLLVSDKNITKTEHELVEDDLLCYKIFKMNYRLPFSTLTSTSCVRESACASCESKDASRISDNWSWKWKIRLWDGQFTLEWSNIRMDVYTNLDLEGYIGWKFKWFKLRWAKAWTRIKPTLIVNITASGNWENSWCKTLFKWSSRYTLWIGPFPVEMLLEFEPIATLSIYMELADAEITCGVNATGHFKAGVGWKRDGGWHMIYDAGMEVNVFEPKVQYANDNVNAWVRPSLQFRLALLFYELAGPFVELEPYATIFAVYSISSNNVTYWVDVGISVNAGIKFTGRVKKILKLSDFKWEIWNRVLWSTREELLEHDVMISHIRALGAPKKAFVTEPINVSVGVINQGTEDEQVNVTLHYWNETSQWEEIAYDEISLRSGYWKAFDFPWIPTADMAPGNYTLNATATISDPEPTGDNNRTDWVYLEVQNVAITNVTTNTDSVTAGEPVYINVTVMNQGTVNVSSLPVSAYYNGNLISDIWCKHTRWVFDRPPGNETTLIFKWNTTGVDAGTYTIKANTSLLPYETNKTDNTKVDGTVTVLSSGKRRDIAITNVTPSRTVVGQGCCMNVTVTVKNEGEVLELFFYVATCANTTIIGTKNVAILPPGNETTITFTWNTTDFAKGNYIISAHAPPVLNETDTTDNTHVDGWVIVTTILGDIDGDGDVDPFDFNLFRLAYGSTTGEPNYNPAADLDGDGDVDPFDFNIFRLNYGKTV